MGVEGLVDVLVSGGMKCLGIPLPCLDEMINRVYRSFYQSLVDQSAYALWLVTLLVGWGSLLLYSIRCDGCGVVVCLVGKVVYIGEDY